MGWNEQISWAGEEISAAATQTHFLSPTSPNLSSLFSSLVSSSSLSSFSLRSGTEQKSNTKVHSIPILGLSIHLLSIQPPSQQQVRSQAEVHSLSRRLPVAAHIHRLSSSSFNTLTSIIIESFYIQGVFFHWYPPKNLKYGTPRLGTHPGPFFLFFYKVYKRPLTPPPLFYKVTL